MSLKYLLSIFGGEANFDSSQNIAIYAPVANGYMTIHENAKLRATSKATNHEAIMLLSGSLTVKDGATLEASSEGTESTIQTGNLMSFEKGSNFLVTNTRGPALGAYAKPTDVAIESLNGLNTWAVGNTQTDNPTNSYSGHLTAVFSLNTFTTGQVTSNLFRTILTFKQTSAREELEESLEEVLLKDKKLHKPQSMK